MPDSLEQIAVEIRGCQRCPLAKGRNSAVPGEGPAGAQRDVHRRGARIP